MQVTEGGGPSSLHPWSSPEVLFLRAWDALSHFPGSLWPPDLSSRFLWWRNGVLRHIRSCVKGAHWVYGKSVPSTLLPSIENVLGFSDFWSGLQGTSARPQQGFIVGNSFRISLQFSCDLEIRGNGYSCHVPHMELQLQARRMQVRHKIAACQGALDFKAGWKPTLPLKHRSLLLSLYEAQGRASGFPLVCTERFNPETWVMSTPDASVFHGTLCLCTVAEFPSYMNPLIYECPAEFTGGHQWTPEYS